MPRTYRFGIYQFNGQTGELWKDGQSIKLQPQPARLLELLLSHAGELVERNQIHQALWGTDTLVDYQLGVNRCIRQIRAALLDNADAPLYIETVARKGYRFNAPVAALEKDPGQDHPQQPTSIQTVDNRTSALAFAQPRFVLSRRYLLLFLGLVFVMSALAWLRYRSRSHLPATFEIRPLASNLGYEYTPTFSPDGEQVAFSWNGERQDNFDIYVKLAGSSRSLRLTTDPAVDYSPAWSPDGRWIAFCRGTDTPGGALWMIPSLGGPARKIMDLRSIADPTTRAISWSPDAKWLVVADSFGPGHVNGLVLVNASSGNIRQLTFPLPQEDDTYPAFSPTGDEIAFTRDSGRGFSSIYLLPFRPDRLEAQKAASLNWAGFRDAAYGRPAWTPRDQFLIFESSRGGPHRLWMAPATQDSQPRVLAQLGGGLSGAAMSADGRLAYVHSIFNSNIWRIDLTSIHSDEPVAPVRVVASTRDDESPAISPDGQKLAFASDRSGFTEVWVSSIDGSDPMQVTFLQHLAGSPSWSADGKSILFDSREQGDAHIYSIPASGGQPVKLTSAVGVLPIAAPDGKWIYFSSRSSGSMQISRVPQPTGPVQQITKSGGFGARPSPDSKFLYYTRKNTMASSLWQLDLSNHQETEIAPSVYLRAFVPEDEGVYFLSGDAHGNFSLHRFNRKTGITERARIDGKIDERGIAMSPDHRFLFFGRLDHTNSELMLVEKFWH